MNTTPTNNTNSSSESRAGSILSNESNKKDNVVIELDPSNQELPVEIPKKPASAYITVVIICLMVAFGGFVFGWDTGTISGFLAQTDFLRRFGELQADGTYAFSNIRTGLLVSIFCLGCAIGGILFSKLGDTYGRRIALVIVTLVYMVGIVICISANTKWYQYAIGRVFAGLGVGGIAVYSPLLISEASPKHLRGTLVSCYQLMITAGIFVGYILNYITKSTVSNSLQWRLPLGLGLLWAILMIGAMFFVPESPRYLIEVGKIEEARRSVARSNKIDVEDPAVTVEIEFLSAAVEAERAAGSASWGELFSTNGKVLQRLIMGICVQSLQQLTGANYFFYYGTTIFKSIGLEDSFQTSIIIGVVNFASTFVGIYFVERFGRRRCLLWGAAVMTVCFAIYGAIGVKALYPNGESQPSSKSAGNVMIVFTCFYIFSFATTWAPIAFVIVAETFPLRIKAKGMAVSVGANWTWNFLIGFFTPFITGAINFYYGFVFMGCLIAAWVYVFFFVPETKGLSLEEVNTMWEEGVLPWKSANWVPPARRDAEYNPEDFVKH